MPDLSLLFVQQLFRKIPRRRAGKYATHSFVGTHPSFAYTHVHMYLRLRPLILAKAANNDTSMVFPTSFDAFPSLLSFRAFLAI